MEEIHDEVKSKLALLRDVEGDVMEGWRQRDKQRRGNNERRGRYDDDGEEQ